MSNKKIVFLNQYKRITNKKCSEKSSIYRGYPGWKTLGYLCDWGHSARILGWSHLWKSHLKFVFFGV
jgi:hypothetical protein